jgi:signal peptidase I
MFLLLVGLFTLFLVNFYLTNKKLILLGGEDKEITKEYEHKKKQKHKKLKKFFDVFLTCVVVFSSLGVFIFSITVLPTNISEPYTTQTVQVVKSSSMSYRNEENTYLFENNITNQFDTFDLVFVDKLPKEEDLKLWDVVVYESNSKLVIHRIIEIEEPNANHPNHRYFKTQGDALDSHDKFPVLYEQMRGIYTGKKVPFVGSFILFLQSYAGYLCIFLIVCISVITPLLEGNLEKLRQKRYLDLIKDSDKNQK